MKILSSNLTTCRVTKDGTSIELQMLEDAQKVVTLQLPFDQAEAMVMTLPSLLTSALRQWTGIRARAMFLVLAIGPWSQRKIRTA
jgi:hypothetical protein